MRSTILVLLLSSALTGCAGTFALKVPMGRIAGAEISAKEPVVLDKKELDSGEAPNPGQEPPAEIGANERSSRVIEPIDSIPRDKSFARGDSLLTKLSARDSLTVASDRMPLRDLLNYVFTEQLKLSFVLVEQGPVLDEPVTLNTQKPVSSRQLYRLISELITEKNLTISERDGVVFIAPVSGKTVENLPISFGRRVEDVPDLPGNFTHVIPLRYVSPDTIAENLRSFSGAEIRSQVGQGAVSATGNRAAVLRILELVNLFDQPSLRSSRIGLVTLTFLDSKQYIEQVSTLLENDGIPAYENKGQNRNVVFVPLEQLGAVAIFAFNSDILSRVEFWTKQIDRAPQGPSQRYFVYQPKFSRASDLGSSLANLIGVGTGAESAVRAAGNSSRDTRSSLNILGEEMVSANALRRETMPAPAGTASTERAITARVDGLTMTVDQRSNSLVFFTSGPRYESLVPLIRRLDVPPKQVLLETTIAEVSLTGEFANGVEFAFANERVRQGKEESITGGTVGGVGLPGGGLALNYISGITDQVKLKLKSSSGLVNVLSNPLLFVRDGVTATISVGNDVPTVGATASNPLQSGTQLTSVLYRKTGLELMITPTINAEGSVVLQIAQQISSANPGSSGVAGAPSFFSRSVSTEVVAASGQTVLLGGLVSESESEDSSGVPGISRVPLLGLLFKSDSKRREKTELVLLVTPKVVVSESDARDVVAELTKALRLMSLDTLHNR